MLQSAFNAAIDPPMPTHSEGLGRAVARSYWQRLGGMPLSGEVDALPLETRIAIIGGGFAGLATALRIKELDPTAEIVLIEGKSVGYGASGRNGGLMSPLPAPVWLATGLNNQAHANAMGLLKDAVTEAAHWATRLAPCAEVTAVPLSLDAKGWITDAGLAHVSHTLSAAGIAHQLAARNARRAPRSLDIEAHTVNPYRLVCGLAAVARKQGIKIVEHASVRAIEDRHDAGAHIVLTDGRTMKAATVVIATNAYTSSIALPKPPRAKVVHNYMLATERLSPEVISRLLKAGRSQGHFVVELNAAYVFYRLHEGRLIFGGIEKLKSAEPGDLDVPAAVLSGLRKHLATTLDGLALPPIAEAWGGRFHMTTTDLPIIQRASATSSIVFNVGYGGTGVALTLSLAPVAAALALTRPLRDANLSTIHNTMRTTRMPIIGAMRFAAGVLATSLAERQARL